MDIKIKDANDKEHGCAWLVNVEYLRGLANSDSLLVDANVIEKLEQEYIDDKYILRWTAIIENEEELRLDGVKRTQSGLIYVPNAFEKQGLAVFFTDKNKVDSSGIWTTAHIWYNEIPYSKQQHVAICIAPPLTQTLFGLQEVVLPHMLWTDKYELPPLSVSVINKGIEIIRENIDHQFELDR